MILWPPNLPLKSEIYGEALTFLIKPAKDTFYFINISSEFAITRASLHIIWYFLRKRAHAQNERHHFEEPTV